MVTILKKFRTAVRNPELILPHLRWHVLPSFYSRLREGYAAPPTALRFTVNNVCNMKCKMCDIGQKQKNLSFYKNIKRTEHPEDIPIANFMRLIDDVKRYKPSIYINTTEPLLYRNLIKIIEYALAQNLRFSVTTNGLLLEKFAHEFVEVGLSELWVSIDGPAKVHDSIRGVSGAFKRTCKGIAMIIEKKRQLGVSLPVVGVGYCISNYNYEYLVETAQIFQQAGIDRMVYAHLNFVDGDMAARHNEEYGQLFGKVAPSSIAATNAKEVDIDILTKQINRLKREHTDFVTFLPDIATREEIETYYYDPSKFVGNSRCKVAWKSAQILTNGDVIVASRCGFSGVMGNINEKPFTKIWNDKPYREFRTRIDQVGATPACLRCCSLLGGKRSLW